MATKSDGVSTMSDLDREIIVMEWTRQLNNQENALLSANLEIKKAERAVQKYHDTILSLQTAIAETKAQIASFQ